MTCLTLNFQLCEGVCSLFFEVVCVLSEEEEGKSYLVVIKSLFVR